MHFLFLWPVLFTLAIGDVQSKETSEHSKSQQKLDFLLKDSKEFLGDSFMTSVMSEQLKSQVALIIKQNPFSLISRHEVKKLILDTTEGTPLGELFQKNHKYLEMTVEWVRDPKALPAHEAALHRRAV